MKKHLYLIPGMSASSKIFERLRFPEEEFKVHLLEWQMPLSKTESIDSYINRQKNRIEHPKPIFIGVSFGGIIAQELAQIFDNSQVIIISSIKHPDELSPFLTFIKKNKLYKLYPLSFIFLLEKIFLLVGSKKMKKNIKTYRIYLPVRDKIYIKWAISTFLNWTNKNSLLNTTHIHGDKDFVLPVKYLKPKVIQINGTHAIILSKASIIKAKILEAMA
ncbi:alpha/beta hydrolase [Wenyingzhuangia sp. IMCC45533]